MEPTTLAVVLLDEGGVITGVGGPIGRFGITADIIGHSWDDAFAGWGLESMSALHQVAQPCRLHATAPTGEPICVELFRLPSAAKEGAAVALFQSEEGVSLTAQQQQLCGLGELSAGVAHEINNALTLLNGWLDLLLADMDADDQRRSTLELLLGEAARIGKLTRNLLQVARGAAEEPQELDLRTLLEEVLSLVRYEMKNSNIELESRLATDLPPICGSSGRLKQAFLNLFVNAQQAMPSGGRMVISAERDGDGYVRVSVQDTGCGIPPEVQSRVFSPFFTTKRNGTGLGLPVTRRIVEDHGGTMHLESRLGAGTRFTLRLPVRSQ